MTSSASQGWRQMCHVGKALLDSEIAVHSRRHRYSECKRYKVSLCGSDLPVKKCTIRIQLLSWPQNVCHQSFRSVAGAQDNFLCQSPLPVTAKRKSILSSWQGCRQGAQSWSVPVPNPHTLYLSSPHAPSVSCQSVLKLQNDSPPTSFML